MRLLYWMASVWRCLPRCVSLLNDHVQVVEILY